MKKIALVLCAVIVAVAILSCSNSENVTPASKSSLALVVSKPSGSGVSNLLLLKDGRTANPVSGIPNFSTMALGKKISLSFRPGAVHNGITDITVTQYSSAQDSVFLPKVPSSDTTSLWGLYRGVFYKADMADSTSNTTSPAQIVFSGAHHYSDGFAAGTYAVSDSTVTFTDLASNGNINHILNGKFNYSLYQNYLYMWVVRNGEYLSYSLKRD